MLISFCKRAIEQASRSELNKLLNKFSVPPTSLKCHGCGAKLQWENKKERGFVFEDTLEKYIRRSYSEMLEELQGDTNEETKHLSIENQKKLHQQLKMQLSQPNAQKQENVHIEINDPDLTQNIENEHEGQSKIKTTKRNMLKCMRCHSLQNYKNIDEEVRIGGSTVEPSKIIKNLLVNVAKGSTVIYLIDIVDIGFSLTEALVKVAQQRRCRLIYVINKIDTLPVKLQQGRIKNWSANQIKEIDREAANDQIFLVSAKTGLGMRKLISYLKKSSEKLKKHEKKLYVIGFSNSGKSTFINRLIKMSNNGDEAEFYHDPFERKQKMEKGSENGLDDEADESEESKMELDKTASKTEFDTSENASIEENEGAKEDSHEIDYVKQKILKNQDTELTVSPYAGTTLDFVEVENVKLGLKIYDSPGIPIFEQIGAFMDDVKAIASLSIEKNITPERVFLKQDSSLWVGALVRIDFEGGDNVDIFVNTSNKISLHRTSTAKANEIYIKHYGTTILYPSYNKKIENVEFVSREVTIKFNNQGIGIHEIAVAGLGWFDFKAPYRKDNFVKLIVYTPKNVGVIVRPALLNVNISRPKSILSKTVKKPVENS